MSIRKQLTMTCDGGDMKPGGEWPKDVVPCTAQYVHQGVQSEPECRKDAKKLGWKTSGFHYCPDHAHFA